MRRNLWLGLVGVLVLAGCEKPKVESTEAPATEAPAEATPVVQEAPKNLPPQPALAAPKVDDEVYLIRRFSIPIDGGMRGFREGSKVTVVAIQGSKVTVAGNDVQFDVQTADISVSPPVAPTPLPKPVASGSAATGSAKPAPAGDDLQKKKERNRITAEISNLEMAYNRSTQTVSQLNARIEQLYAKISGSSGNSPEARAREAEVQRLGDAVRNQQAESSRLQRAIALKQRELKKLN